MRQVTDEATVRGGRIGRRRPGLTHGLALTAAGLPPATATAGMADEEKRE
jgi:hypothetical protein